MAGNSSWKVAYADFVTALMAFFLLMWILNMAPEETKVQLASYFSDPNSFTAPAASSPISTSPPVDQDDSNSVRPLSQERSLIEIPRFLSEQLQLTQIVIGSMLTADRDQGILLRAASTVTFAENSVNLEDESLKLLDVAIEVLRRFEFFVVIRGHTDSAETGGPTFESKWALAAARSAVVAEYLIETGKTPARRVTVVSYADTRPRAAPDLGGVMANNRCVELFFYSPNADMTLLGF